MLPAVIFVADTVIDEVSRLRSQFARFDEHGCLGSKRRFLASHRSHDVTAVATPSANLLRQGDQGQLHQVRMHGAEGGGELGGGDDRAGGKWLAEERWEILQG